MKKQLRWIISLVPAMALIVFVSACATQTGQVAKSDVESALIQAGFKVKPATTPEQQQHLQSLPERQFVAVRQHGKRYYLCADKPNKRLYSGSEQAYRTYKANRQGAVTYIADPAGYAIPVTVYHGFAPFNEW